MSKELANLHGLLFTERSSSFGNVENLRRLAGSVKLEGPLPSKEFLDDSILEVVSVSESTNEADG